MSSLAERIIATYSERPRTAILMSGQGSNAKAILQNQKVRSLYEIVAIVTDNGQSSAKALADKDGLDLLFRPAGRLDETERRIYFDNLSKDIGQIGVQALFYAGYMKIVTEEFCERFEGVNIHPADLSLIGADGLPKYRGMDALPLMRRELGYVRSTVHAVEGVVDSGRPLALTEKLYPFPSEDNKRLHERLKQLEHTCYTNTLIKLGEGVLTLSDLPARILDE